MCPLSEDEKVDAVVVAMEGDALKWYLWENGRTPVTLWLDLGFYINFVQKRLFFARAAVRSSQITTILEYLSFKRRETQKGPGT